MQWVVQTQLLTETHSWDHCAKFEYFAKSRGWYKLLRKDYELPNISTLTRLTS